MFVNVTAAGRIANDLEIKQTNSGKSVMNFGLAVDRGYGDNKTTDFFDVTVWNKTAELLAAHKQKGSSIIVNGTLQNDKYEDRQGNKRTKTFITANQVTFLPDRTDGQSTGGSGSQSGSGGGSDDEDDDDIPF